ncbi:MAG: FAD-dependent oxidoreductase [Chloroflexota bacterium]
MFPKLFQPGKIGRLELANRVVKAPMLSCLATEDGVVTDRLIQHYVSQTSGGTGLIIVEASTVNERGSQAVPFELGSSDDRFLPGLTALAKAIHDAGGRAALQISHGGILRILGAPKLSKPILVPSPVPDNEPLMPIFKANNMIPEALTFEDVIQTIQDFGNAARRVQAAGYDMVEVHGAHGFLINNFLSPITNRREDRFGGSPEKRMNFLLEIIDDVRKKVGPDFPVCVRLSGSEYEKDGYDIDFTIALARELEKRGVNALHLSGGNHHRRFNTNSPMSIPTGWNVWAAEAVKKAVKIPVMASGSITTPELAEDILASGKADFITLGRPLFADPAWTKKAQEGRPEDITPCIRCLDGCLYRSNMRAAPAQCTVNGDLGREGRFPVPPAEKKKRVAVAGGGPAGLEAARVCALRGHEVTLYEPRELGGTLLEISVPDFMADLRLLIKYYAAQMKKLDVKVVKEKATAAGLKKGNFDTVVVAVGGVPVKPDVPGIDLPLVTGVLDVLSGKARTGQRVVVVGGGVEGAQVGLWLAEQGKEVTFVEERPAFMMGVWLTDKAVYAERFAKQKVTPLTGTRLTAIKEKSVAVIDKEGKPREIPTDSVVLALGLAPNPQLQEELSGEKGLEVHGVGDCVFPRKIFEAIRTGFSTARRI